jgi:hypothetical protein
MRSLTNSYARFWLSDYSHPLPLTVFILTLFGYPIIGNLVSMLQIESRLLTIPFRAFIVFISLLVIIKSKEFKLNPWHTALFLFWIAYLFRLFYDSIYTNIPDASYALQFFIASCVIPVIALMKSRKYEEYTYAKYSLFVATIGCVMSLTWRLFDTSGTQDELVSGRLSEVALNPITIGNLGVSAILCSISILKHRRKNIFWIIFVSLALIISLFCVILAESKGPILALIVSLIIWGFSSRKVFQVLLIVCFAIFLYLAFDEEIGTRVSMFLIDPLSQQSTQIRLTLIEDAIKQISTSPFIGSAFVELNSQQYPHNIFIEAALAVGIPFAIVFFIIITKGIIEAWKSLQANYFLLPLLYFQALIGSMVSGALFGAPMLWVTLALLLYRRKS